MLSIGWSSRDMTPTRPAMLQGQMHRRVAREAMDPLTVTALAVEGGTPPDCAVAITCDLATVSDGLLAAVRARLARLLPAVPGEKVFMCATHTHTSLVIEAMWYEPAGGDVMTAEECEALIADRAAAAAVDAWNSRTPHSLRSAYGHAVVGHNRRAVYADGTASMYGRTDRADFAWIEGYEDHGLDLTFTWDRGGYLTGVLVAIPCPSQVDEGLEVFSADFWHDIRLELRRRLGASLHVLPLCAASGDQSPHFMVYGREEAEMRRRRGVTERQEIALRVADATERALACTRPPEAADVPFAHTVRQVALAPRRISQAERDWARAECGRLATTDLNGSWWFQCLKGVADSFDSGRTPPRVPTELHALRLGDAVLTTNPYELYVDYALRIKARSPAAQTMVIQLVSGTGLYLPTERGVRGGGYGAMPAVSLVGPEGGAELVEETLAMIRGLFPA